MLSENGVFRWSPGFHQHGSHSIEVIVSDGEAETRQNLNVEVGNVNGPVSIDALERFSTREGQPIVVHVGVFDGDVPGAEAAFASDDAAFASGNRTFPVTLTHSPLPSGAVFDMSTFALRWTPNFQQSASYSIVFNVVDDGDGTGLPTTDRETLVIDVTDTNGTPTIDAVGNQIVNAGALLDLDLVANDPEGNPIDLEVRGLPNFATFTDNTDGTAHLRATPTELDRGNYVVTVIASDNGNGTPANILRTEYSFVLSAQPTTSRHSWSSSERRSLFLVMSCCSR